MANKIKRYVEEGWAVWIDGEDVSTVYLHYWVNPKDKSYVDVSIKAMGINQSKILSVFVPYEVRKEEIEDVSLKLYDEKAVRANFSASSIITFCKNPYTSEIAYNGKTIDVVHISKIGFSVRPMGQGSLIEVDFGKIQSFIDNDEGYFSFRLPQKSLDKMLKTYSNFKSRAKMIRDLISAPVLYEKYSYSVRINEKRLLPGEINKIGTFHRQKMNKAQITVSLNDNYEVSGADCSLVRRLEEDLFKEFAPKNFKCDDVISYQWKESSEENMHRYFNFHFDITKTAISKGSFILYLFFIVFLGVLSEIAWDIIKSLIGL